MLHYIIQTIAFQLFFLLAYDVFLKKETFFNWNRIYLLATASLSIVLPFIKLNSLKAVVPQDYIVSLPEVVLGQTTSPSPVIALDAVVLKQNALSFWEIVFYIGLCIACCLFLFKVIKIAALVLKNPKQSIGNIVLVELINSTAAFSFFNYIFLGGQIKTEDKETIIEHELIHAQQKHTLDLLFFEVLRILFWFNPLVYMYQNRIRTLHEFIADAHAVKHQNKHEYYQNLLAQVFQTEKISFINTFFKQSLIKKRIVMLQKTKSKQIHLLKYALLIPLVFGMLIYTSAEAQEKVVNKSQDLSQYSYTLKKGEELVGEKKKVHEKYETFLKNNKDYVGWTQINRGDNTISYSVHHIDEKVPKGFSKSEVSSPDGSSYIVYFNWGNQDKPKELSAEEKKQKEKKLLKLKEQFKDAVEVPFAVIDQVPVFPGCENLSKEEQKKCISLNISKHVNRNFNTNLATQLGLVGRQRINVIFKIDKGGNVIGIRSRAPHPDLEAEAIRVIKTLPKMTPGKHNGKHVIVPYSLPIIFQVQDQSAVDETVVVAYGVNKEKNSVVEDIEVPFAVIENVPVYPGCEDLESNVEKKRCMSEKLTKFVIENFNTKKASEYGLVGRQRINVIFSIDPKGNIIKVRSRGPHPALEAEAIRVISSLPKMKPGLQKGKAVTVPYSLPIIFNVEDTQLLDETVVVGYKGEIEDGVLPFHEIDQIPLYPECESIANIKEQKKCVSKIIQNHVVKNFNTSLAKNLGLTERQRINIVFKIDESGNFIDIKPKAESGNLILEKEAVRVIKTLPKMIPGKHKGKHVKVNYALPVIFSIRK